MHLVLGIGGSADSMLALHETAERAATVGDDLTVAILENPSSERSPDEIEALVREELRAYDLEATVTHLDGQPGPALVSYAESNACDRLVLGGGRRSPMGKIAVGKIAEFVILNADVSITLIR